MKTKNWFLKVINWIACISAVLAVISVVVGLISSWVGRIIPGTESVNFFHLANSFFLCGILLFVFIIKQKIDKE